MTPHRREEILATMPATARRLFQFVPIVAPWTVQQIVSEAGRQWRAMPINDAFFWLNKLVDAKIIRRLPGDNFVRYTERTKGNPVTTDPEFFVKDNTMAANPTTPKAQDVFDMLAAISASLDAHEKALQLTRKQVEAAMEALLAERDSTAEKLKQFDALRTVLKGLS